MKILQLVRNALYKNSISTDSPASERLSQKNTAYV